VRGFLNGIGIAEEIAGIQYEINRCLIMMSESLMFCVPKLLVEEAHEVVKTQLDDIAGKMIVYQGQASGSKPSLVTWNAIPQQLFTQFENLVRRGYEVLGISPMSAQSQKPADLESAPALREMADIESGRFYQQGKRYEEFEMEVATLAIRQAREIADRNEGRYKVRSPNRRRMVQEIDWRNIDLDDEAYVMQVFPTSSLPRTPAGRLAMVTDLMNLGFLDKEDALRLLQFPDLEAVNEIMEAAAEFTNWQIDGIIEDGRYSAPQPYQNLAYTLRHGQSAYLLAQTMEVEPGRVEMLRKYVEETKALIAAATPPVPQPGIPGGPPTMPAPGEPQVAPEQAAARAAMAGGGPAAGAPAP
jgi:hypothetical protein